jgi:light-regulated signal transduction histidine kinase (bacteriophytochrome)
MSDRAIDLTLCDREPIHSPGSIQPHGVILVVDPDTLSVTHAAGDIAAWLGRSDWLGASIADLLGEAVATEARRLAGAQPGPVSLSESALSEAAFDVQLHRSGTRVIVEVEAKAEGASANGLLPRIEAAAAAFERTPNLQQLFDAAAVAFGQLTGYDRVMIYRFLEDDAGIVVAETSASGQKAFLNHHFPAADIPKQARALYVRNLVRVIPDVTYTPAPLVPAWDEPEPLDMSDAALRSVSPIHLQYLKNMGVAASASFSIVKDGALWGLIACHNETPRRISVEVRAGCRALAGGLSRQIKAREETDAYRERIRLRSFEDDIVALLLREGSLDEAISNHVNDIMRMLDGDGVAVLRGEDLVVGGRCPEPQEIRRLASWCLGLSSEGVFATDRLGESYALPEGQRAVAAGLLAMKISATEPWLVMWFRAEHVEVVNWAGNPHKTATAGPSGVLTPRASFEAWSETVRGRARRWTLPEIEAAGRLRVAVMGVWQTRQIRDLNRQLLITLDEKELLLRQKEFLIGEVNHRVQNSLQLVSSFLALQARASDNPELHAAIEEARRRLAAVSLVHRRLYRADQIEAIDAGRYVDELLTDLVASLGPEWGSNVIRDLHPVMLPADRAVGLGLVLTELVINVNKYAYGGGAGPVSVTLAENANRFRLIVADEGVGRGAARKGFGSRMMDALVAQLAGTMEFQDNNPGTRVILSAPITQSPGR